MTKQIEHKWSKSSEKMLDELFEGKEEITLLEKEPTTEEMVIDLFSRFCAISDKLIETERPEQRSILLIILKDAKERFKIEEKNVTGINAENVKSYLKDKDMFGYIMSVYVKRATKENVIVGNSVMRTLYTPKIFLKSIRDIEGSKPRIFNERNTTHDTFDLWAITENPRNKIGGK